MASVKIYNALGDYKWLPDQFDEASLKLKDHDAISLVIEDADGETFAKYSGGNYDVAAAYKALIKDHDIYDFATFLNKGNDKITGSNLAEDIWVGQNAGNDVIKAMGGDDFIKAYAGNNNYDGGKGFDVLSYEETVYDKDHATKGVIIDVAHGTAKNSWGGTDKFSHMEEYRGSHLGDKITGSNAQYEQFIGFNGKDAINGGAGFDSLHYERDVRFGGNRGISVDLAAGTIKDGFGKIDTVKNIEEVVGTAKADVFLGDKNGNGFHGLEGSDSYDGKGGLDYISFSNDRTAGSISVDLSKTTGQVLDDGHGNTETALHIEAVEGGSGDDTIKLGASTGYALGNGGADTLISGEGKQTLEGSGGLDTFVLLTSSGIGTQSGKHDVITDFNDANELIDFSAMGTSAYFIGTEAFSSSEGQVRYEQVGSKTFVYADYDGNGAADFALELSGAHTLTSDNFILNII